LGLLLSCQEENPLDLFYAKSYLHLSSTYRLKILTPQVVNSGKVFKRPGTTLWPILKLSALDSQGIGLVHYCLIYKSPTKQDGLLILKPKLQKSCSEQVSFEKSMRIDSVFDLKVYLNKTHEKKKDIPPHHLVLVFKRKKRDHRLSYPLFNLSSRRVKGPDSRRLKTMLINEGEDIVDRTYLPGVVFFGEEKPSSEKKMNWPKNDFFKGVIYPCHRINEQCETVGENTCDECPFGQYETVPTKCPLSGDKFCGLEVCGKKGFPACYRGYEYARSVIKFGCYDKNPAGFCEEDLQVICGPNGLLLCD
jgi:hypothetical protein